jgi:hypothetical protein
MRHQDSLHTSLRLRSVRALGKGLLTSLAVLGATQAWAFQAPNASSANRTGASSGGGGAPTTNAPEINPALLVGAAVLLVGGVLILTSRRRRATKA